MIKKLEKIHKASVLKQVRDFGSWTGFIAPSKVNSHHINDGWHLGVGVKIVGNKDQYYVETENEIHLLENFINEFLHWHASGELGKTVRFWKEIV